MYGLKDRAYAAERISRERRSQPIEELRRKMLKAVRRSLRKRYTASIHSVEGGDWSAAIRHQRRMNFRTKTLLSMIASERKMDRFCFSCHGFGPEGGPVKHKDNCTFGCPPPMVSAAPGLAGPRGKLP